MNEEMRKSRTKLIQLALHCVTVDEAEALEAAAYDVEVEANRLKNLARRMRQDLEKGQP